MADESIPPITLCITSLMNIEPTQVVIPMPSPIISKCSSKVAKHRIKLNKSGKITNQNRLVLVHNRNIKAKTSKVKITEQNTLSQIPFFFIINSQESQPHPLESPAEYPWDLSHRQYTQRTHKSQESPSRSHSAP